MSITTNYLPVDFSYAQALLELAGDDAVAIGDEMGDLRQIVDENPTFQKFLADPSIGDTERNGLLERTFKGKVSPLIWNFLGVLNAKNRLGRLGDIAGAYHTRLDEKLGKVEVTLTVAQPLTDEQLIHAQRQISTALGKEAIVHTHVDDSIIGGMIVRVRDKLLDASVRYQLQAMKEQLLAKRPS